MRQPPVNPVRTLYICVNCDAGLSSPGTITRGPDSAWHLQCQACHELVDEQMMVIEDQPGGKPIQLYECGRCLTTRACRVGWHTRCHVCLDERSTGRAVADAGESFLIRLKEDPALDLQARQFLQLTPTDPILLSSATEASSYLALQEMLLRRSRPGWEIIATDVYGLPWTGIRTRHISHGTWARHTACGAIIKLPRGSADCPVCGPEPGSRTYAVRRDQPYLLYLVRTPLWKKFGIGGEPRVREHARAGAQVIQVIQAPFAQVVLAERTLKQRHHESTQLRPRSGMATSFGQGTEVTRRWVTVNLRDVLPDGEDVTSWFV